MYVTCHKCNGEGFILRNIGGYRKEGNIRKVLCISCWSTFNSILKGKIWVNDLNDPLTPPSSPK
jgi:hypothetical protein